jgi:hypothetical protein
MKYTGGSMTYKSIAILIFCASAAATVWAQRGDDKIDGTGTPHFIARFTGNHELEDSNIFQDGPNLGVNTTTPEATLDVEGKDIDGLIGSTSSTGHDATGVIGRTVSPTGNWRQQRRVWAKRQHQRNWSQRKRHGSHWQRVRCLWPDRHNWVRCRCDRSHNRHYGECLRSLRPKQWDQW